LYDALYGAIRVGLVAALHDVFLLGALLGVLGVITVLFLQEIPLRKSYAPAAPSDSAAQVGHEAFPSLPTLKPEDQPEAERQLEEGLVV
jgi:hypothetical protein